MKRLAAILALVLVLTAPVWAVNTPLSRPSGPYVSLSPYSLWSTKYILKAEHGVTWTIHGISPTGNLAADKSVTVKPSDGTYTTLAGAIAGELAANADLVSMAGILNIEIGGTWSSADTAAVNINGFTTSAAYYVNIYTVSPARHAGVWSTSKYNLTVSNATAIQIRSGYVRIDGLQISVPTQTGTGQDCIDCYFDPGAEVYLSNCIVKGSNNGTYVQMGYRAYKDAYLWNDIFYNFASISSDSRVIEIKQTSKISSCTVIGGYYGICRAAGTATVKNCYAGGSTNGDYYDCTMTTCASADATGTAGLQGILVSTTADSTHAGFTNITATTEDFHIKVGSPLMGVGTDTSGDAAPMNFTTDIDGVAKTTVWDIGADEYVAAGGPVTINNILIIIGLVCLRRKRMR
jgi:hypothetical protein